MKHKRHCWFTRMLYCPARWPESFSRRLLGGMRKSAKSLAASNIWSFLKSALRQVGGTRLGSDAPSQNASMSLSLNLLQYFRVT